MKPCVIMRSCNDMPVVAETLAMIRKQTIASRLIVFDNESTDGTARLARELADEVVTVPAGEYVPGRVLNQAMTLSNGELVAFVNSDSTPQNKHWLDSLLGGFNDHVGATFGRQVPRPDCPLLYAKDTEDTYGQGDKQGKWRQCFSMASSAIRREVWRQTPFSEDLAYSEDLDWTWRIQQAGWRIRYVPDSIVAHSHNYTLRQLYRRQYGEGMAEATIFDWSAWQRCLLRYSLMPYSRQVLSDIRYCFLHAAFGSLMVSPVLRLAQDAGRRAGFLAGWRNKSR